MSLTLYLMLVILVINAVPAIYYSRKYLALKKARVEDDKYNGLVKDMNNADKVIIPIMLFSIIAIALINV